LTASHGDLRHQRRGGYPPRREDAMEDPADLKVGPRQGLLSDEGLEPPTPSV